MREEGKEKGREGLSLPLQMSVDDRVKLTCSPHYTYIWGGESFQRMVDRQDHSINQYPEMAERQTIVPYTISDSEIEHVDTHAQKV